MNFLPHPKEEVTKFFSSEGWERWNEKTKLTDLVQEGGFSTGILLEKYVKIKGCSVFFKKTLSDFLFFVDEIFTKV